MLVRAIAEPLLFPVRGGVISSRLVLSRKAAAVVRRRGLSSMRTFTRRMERRFGFCL